MGCSKSHTMDVMVRSGQTFGHIVYISESEISQSKRIYRFINLVSKLAHIAS